MRNLFLTAVLAGGALLGSPREARADCLGEAVASCNEDFPNSSKELIAVRGWCYIIRGGMCKAGL